VSYIEADRRRLRLFEMWFEQKLLDDKLSIRIGQIAADSELSCRRRRALHQRNVGLAINHCPSDLPPGWASLSACDASCV